MKKINVKKLDKNEKRRLVIQKQNARKEQNMTMYGAESGAAVVVGKTVEFNRRLLAALLAFVFVLTTLVVGVNIATKAQGTIDEDGYGMMETVDEDTGMVLRKGYLYDESTDTYSLKLEAYSTKDTTEKAVKADTPLDIVMVLDQSNSMTTKDVLKGRNFYQASDKSSFTISEIENGDYYYYDSAADKYYPVSFTDRDEAVEESYVIAKDNGTEKVSWTAQQARAWVQSHSKNLYYKNVTDATNNIFEYEKVWVDRKDWYKNAGTISATTFIADNPTNYSFWTKNDALSTVYYYNSEGDINTNEPFWHRVYENTRGVTGGGYYIYLWYNTESVEDTEVSNYFSASNSQGWSDVYYQAENAGKVKQIPNKPYHDGYHSTGGIAGKDHDWSNGWENYDAWLRANIFQNSNNYTGGQLYIKQTATSSTPLNYMYTSNGTNGSPEIRKLAWPNVATASQNSVDSITWNGNLYTAGYLMYYTDDNGNDHYIGTAVNEKSENGYVVADNDNVQLYEKETITRLEAQKLAANNYAQKIAANIGNRDYRIAVVGNANSGTIYSGGQTAANAFVTDSNDIESAVTALTADNTNGTALSDGLTKAEDVFQANLLDPADARKRIVIVLGDQDTWNSAPNSDANIRRADAVLKDEYNASVYTIGLFNGAPNASTETFMSQMSSEYFFKVEDASNTNAYKQMNGTYHYIANSNVFPDEANSIISTFGTVATTSVTSPLPTTEFVLDNTTAFLKDVIHENFNLPSNLSGSTTVKVASGSYSNDELTWGTASNAGSPVAPSWDGRTLIVTGFDYDANYVSDNHPGQKIIVTISGLTINQRVRTESSTAKRIYFNTTASGIYKDGAEELVVNKFPRPFLDDQTWLAPAGGTGTMNENGIVVNKYLTPTENGTYDLTVEAYTTETSTTTIEKVPTDFIVVADQSGSMDEADMPTGYKEVSGTKTLEEIANGKYYVKGADGNYYRVFGTRSYMYRYYPANYFYVGDLIDRFGTNLGWFMGDTESETTFTNQMYFREVKNGQTYYQPITMTVKGVPLTYYIKFHFDSVLTNNTYWFDRDNTQYSNNGNSPWYKAPLTGNVYKSGWFWSSVDSTVQAFYRDDNAYTFSEALGINTGMYVNYPMYDRHVGYNQLLYRDTNGTEHILSATTGQTNYEFCNDNGQALISQTGTQPTYSGLYEATGYQTRLEALKNALTEFAQAVADESHLNNATVDNRIAIVGFSSPGTNGSYSTYNNTEILTGENLTVRNNNGTRIDNATDSDYATALVSATNGSVGSVNDKITDAISALTANGGTQPEDGLNMAYNILDKRSSKTYTIQTGADAGTQIDRNTIVIYFTDGRPGDYTISNQYKEANEVVDAAKNIKSYKPTPSSTKNTSVFSIGVFGESDGNPLTYPAHQVGTKNAEYEYDLGWMETFDGYGYPSSVTGGYRWQYLNRNWRSGSPADYGAEANDTIYDYMSVVSSNYPNATQYMKVKGSNPAGEADTTGYSNYLDMLDGVRGSYVGNNDYYRMASNQATLIAAFAQAVTMMNQTISVDQRLDAASVMQDVFNNTNFTVEDGYSIRTTTVDGSMDKYGIVSFDESTEAPASGVIANLRNVNGNQTVTVTGFDYLENYINYGYTDPDTGAVIEPHNGKKLVVTISNVVPTVTGERFYSNISDNHASSMYVSNSSVTDTDFPTPSISRHSYTLDVGDINKNATFAVAVKILDASGNEMSKDSSNLDDVILVYPNGTRKLYSEVGPQEFLQVGNGQSFYLENLPSTYTVQTDVTSTDDAYVYTIWFDDDTANEQEMTKGTPVEKTFDYLDDHVIHITSVRGTKEISIRERTIGSYGNVEQIFDETVTMEIPVIEGETTQLKYDCTFNDDYCGFENGLPSGATYKAIFEVDTEHSTADKTVAKLVGIEYTQGGTTGTWPVTNNQLPMRDGDEITFTAVPVGNTVKVQEGDTHEHDVFYYYGQDDVSPSGVKLMTSSGDLLDGTHTLTFAPVDGLTAENLTVTFENGSITQVNGNAVPEGYAIDFAQYQTMYVINDDLSDAKLNIDGTDVYFDTETDGNDTAYVATIKRQTNRPPVSVTVEKNDMDILIVNERGDIPIEGIFDSHKHNVILYILLAAGVSALAGGGTYVWRKKDEFIEE